MTKLTDAITEPGGDIMEISTSSFRALTGRLEAMEAELAAVRGMLIGEHAGNEAARETLIEVGKLLQFRQQRREEAEEAARRKSRHPRPRYLHLQTVK
jgi:hypothetical protein